MSKGILMRTAGVLAILVALVHGISAEFRLFPTVTAGSPAHLMLLRMVWQASTLSWATLGVLLFVAPSMGDRAARWIGGAALVNFAAGSLGGLFATGWQHYGWMLLATLCALVVFALPKRVPH